MEGLTLNNMSPLPLFGGLLAFLAVAAAWAGGSAVIIGRKFSATRYWDEVRQNDATVIQYVGEVCRYLLSTPPSPKDKEHRVRYVLHSLSTLGLDRNAAPDRGVLNR